MIVIMGLDFDRLVPQDCCNNQDLHIVDAINWDNWIYECENCKQQYLRRHRFYYKMTEKTEIHTVTLGDDEGNEFKIVLGVSNGNRKNNRKD